MRVRAMDHFLAFLSGGGEMGERIRAHDWSKTTIGTPETWPQTLQTAIGLLLGAKQPVYVAWGHDLISFYNDGYLPIIGNKHPALGEPFSVLWAEIWNDFRPIVEATLGGEAQHFVDLPIALAGRPGLPVGYFTFSYTALRDEQGRSVGFYCAATETTMQVLLKQRTLAEHEQLSQLLAEAPSFMCLLQGPDFRFALTNDAYLQLVGHRDLIGMTVREALPEVQNQGFLELLAQVYTTGQPFVGRGLEIELQRIPGAPLEKAFLNFVYQPIINQAGKVTGIFVEGSDITDLKRAELALRDSQVQVQLALAAAEMGVWESTLANGTFSNLRGDDRALTLLGGQPGEQSSFDSFVSRVHPEDRAVLVPAAQQALDPAGTGLLTVEYRVLAHGSHPERWVQALAQAITEGDQVRLVGTVRDISDRKQAEARQGMLSGELQHRIKNIVAMVSAIASQTLKGDDIADRRGKFMARLEALSHAHDMLVATVWTEASIRNVVEGALVAHRGEDKRFTISGPDLILSPRQALSLTLTVHELATNATKYGALSVEAGRVQIEWSIDTPDGIDPQFQFVWQEVGGPAVMKPDRTGFGSRLITRVLAADFSGTVKIDYSESGVTCRLEAPASQVSDLK